MARFTKVQIQFHRDGFDDPKPAINVKVRNFGGNDAIAKLMDHFGVGEEQAAKALEIAWDSAQFQFWHDLAPHAAEETLTKAFGPVEVYSEGRSGGWLVVWPKRDPNNFMKSYRLPDVAQWDAIKVNAWGQFVGWIRTEIGYLCSYRNIEENIEENGWLVTEAERVAAVSAETAEAFRD